ncbi:PREDICTED: receptor-like tyrosine-protein kinase kin-16 isoform X4 [Amphimedon queenslandica]|uniref:non-specific protein-tyrosine kinase n=1 Tax=Amphimedon queenslandica TaxID=400682 RepID=A0AAN0JRV4_AMPQE|nr:PREDICTED: receptor-like tyrosine-protein kinase kin-16 isoform X4 [Amphimedon queenslandica]|eukprot:XP_019859582.1 PREDICTED: receptor-like tyrosine-protein kinase kin-16 isoform X4 [Amphimedon queenslandica]
MQASDFKSKVKQIEREKAANTKKRMLLKENEHLQSTLRIRISRKEVLQDNEKEIEELQESISSISVKLLKMQTYRKYLYFNVTLFIQSTHKIEKATQTVLSSNGSICEAQDDYNDPVISFKKDELLQLSTNGHKELHSLRMPTSEQKLFVASCNVQALKLGDLTIKKGEVLEVVKYVEDGDWWYMHSLHTDNNGCVPVKYMIPIKGELSKMYYKYIYYHTVSRNEAKERLSQADTQAESMNGNLKDYLTSYNPTPAELVDIAIQVTDGMMYLGEQDYIHCSLKAANILLGDHNTVKIANFHLAQHLNGNKYWTVEEGAKLAIRWPAPEFYTLKRLSIKSDVWSFGILLWEMVTKGDVYPGITTNEVRELVSKGDCIYIPRGCLEPFDQLMINCRKHKDYERPSFKNIFDVLIKYDTHDT